MYETIEKDLAEFYVERCPCWFHARHYLVDAYISDERMKPLLLLINALFYIEQESVRRKHTLEHMFRHIAIGRRNWLYTGSHFEAENIAFMYSLLESCKLNNVNFGEYIEDILTRLMKGEKADLSFLPNNYVPRSKEETNKAA